MSGILELAAGVELEGLPRPTEVNSLWGGIQAVWKFDNGYGASVINHAYSRGVELAVLGPDGDLTYDTPITDDVVNYIADVEELAGLLRSVRDLPPKEA